MSHTKTDDGLRPVMIFEDREEADAFILDLPAVLKELDLDHRFTTLWAPRVITERQQRGKHRKITACFYEVCMRDRFPEAAPPALTVLDVTQAWDRVKRMRNLPSLNESPQTESEMTAFGRTQDIKDWAKVFRTKPSVIRKYLEQFEDLESALSAIELKRSA